MNIWQYITGRPQELQHADQALYAEFATDYLKNSRIDRVFSPTILTTDQVRIRQEMDFCWTIRPTLCLDEFCSLTGSVHGWCGIHSNHVTEYDSATAIKTLVPTAA